MNKVKAQALVIRVLLVLGMLLVMAAAIVDTPAGVSAHGGDTTLVHLCVNDTNAETLTVFPLPIGDATIDCVNPPWPLGPGWSPVDVGTISGVTAGTGLTGGGTLGPVTLSVDPGYRVPQNCLPGQLAKLDDLPVWVCGDDLDTDTQLSEGQVELFVVNGPLDLFAGSTLNGVGILTGAGTFNKIAKFTGATTIEAAGIFEDAVGNVGIGTAIPVAPLTIFQDVADSSYYQFPSGPQTVVSAFRGGAIEALDSRKRVRLIIEGTTVDTSPSLDFRIDDPNGFTRGVHLYYAPNEFWPGQPEHFGIWTHGAATALAVNSVNGNVGIGTTTPAAKLDVAGTTRTTVLEITSDRNAKENFAQVDGREVLERLSEIPIETWNLKAYTPSERHMGPMAQDFHAAFGLGKDDKYIASSDIDGVALAAIQGLYEIGREKDSQIEALQGLVDKMEMRLAFLERAAGQP